MTQPDADAVADPQPLPERNEMHYNRGVFEHVDWSHRGAYMYIKHGITPAVADEALGDPNRVLIDPDYNSESGQGVRIIGFSTTAANVITVIVLEHEGTEYGVNGWAANQKDRRFYAERSEGDADEQND